ncbi:hypothetical protein KVT40_003918 [Elsinoe batatas]|uniref:Uncharacterized protein n=1 Tax=Elsinoe batatas TaxID=2601811 RepID=A0A8K0L5W1_9PEZI|nr:hypothetical protein KVT40_003918 [Elsinoe batatas]
MPDSVASRQDLFAEHHPQTQHFYLSHVFAGDLQHSTTTSTLVSRFSNQADMTTPGPDNTSSCESGPRRSGRNDGKQVNYDARLHPSYDKAMKPIQYAKLMDLPRPSPRAWRSSSAASDTSSRSSSSNRSNASDDSDHTSDTPLTEEFSGDDMPTSRSPDAKATRRSSRAAAQKYHNYSREHHPQDKYLPGRRKRKDTIGASHSTPSRSPKVPIKDNLETRDQSNTDNTEQEPPRKKVKRGSQQITSQGRIGNAEDSRRAGATAAVTITSSPVRPQQAEDDSEDEQDEDDTVNQPTNFSQNKDGISVGDQEHEPNDFQEPSNEHEDVLDDEDDDTTPTDDLNALEDMIDSVDAVEAATYKTNEPLDLADVNAAARASGPPREKVLNDRTHQGLTDHEQNSRPHGARLSFQDDTLAPEMDMESEDFHAVTKPDITTQSRSIPGNADVIRGLQLIAGAGLTQEQLMALFAGTLPQGVPSSADSFAARSGSRIHNDTPQSSIQSAFTALSSSAPPVGSQRSSADQHSPASHPSTQGTQDTQGHSGRPAKGTSRPSSELGTASQKLPTGRPSQLGLRPDLTRSRNDAPEGGNRASGSAASSRPTSTTSSQRLAPSTSQRSRVPTRDIPITPEPHQQLEADDDSASTLSGGVVDDMDGLGAIGR